MYTLARKGDEENRKQTSRINTINVVAVVLVRDQLASDKHIFERWDLRRIKLERTCAEMTKVARKLELNN